MSIKNIDKIFKPASIAVVGASNREGSIGSAIFRNLIYGGFTGNLYPVNQNSKTIGDKKAFPSILDIGKPIDLAVISVPIIHAPQIIKECVKADVGGAVIISAGGKEAGKQGEEIEHRIKKETDGTDLRIIGPNCLGVMCSKTNLNASFASHPPLPGKMAFISQSGAICTSILDLSYKERMGFSHVVTLGSMLDVEFGDVIDYLGDDPDVSSIVMYIESLARFRNFMSAARAVSRIKPIIALKAGRTKAGAMAAASHTGALTGEDEIYDAAFKRAGIVRVKTFEELFDCAELLSKQPKPSGSNLAIISNAGGPGVMAVDTLYDYGKVPATLSSKTIAKLNTFLPPHWSKGNPVDIIGDATPERYRQTVDVCINAPEINCILIMLSPAALINSAQVAEILIGNFKNCSKPIFTAWIGGSDVEKGRELFNYAGFSTFDTPERAVRAFMNLYKYSILIDMLQEIPPKLNKKIKNDKKFASELIKKNIKEKTYLITEFDSKNLLNAYGIPVNKTLIACNEEDAVVFAEQIGYPVVLKICSSKILHKTDVNGVKLNIKNEPEVRKTYNEIIKNTLKVFTANDIQGVTVQKMIDCEHHELIIGATRDNDFGPVIMFGKGGITAELLKDKAVALPPLNRLLARRLMKETNVFKILQGFRNIPPVNMELLEEILIRLSQLVIDFPEIDELDINPLLINTSGVFGVDARIVLKPTKTKSPHHLVISSYPNHQERHVKCQDGEIIFIRPVRPEDADLMVEMFESLSTETVRKRFFSPLKRLPHKMLARFTQPDYDREIVLTAISENKSHEKMIGVARIISGSKLNEAEIAVLIADKWQGRGIGANLMKYCLDLAGKRGIEKVYGIVLPENKQMLSLCKKLGFTINKSQDSSDYELIINIDPNFSKG